ncbi:GlsB/YeaQ/YmgE family stress response membrane protein [Patescibacteria group bacterium]|nr:GlsB/YeaQ/YmgE family stress response membrane protein [Patescibacteria group bacterium]
MGIISWIILGGLAGWTGSMIMGTDASQGVFLNIVIGIIGAIIGGLVFSFFGAAPVTGFNFYSFAVAIVGSVIAIWAVQMLRGAS